MRFLILLCLALSALSAAETKLPADAAKLVDRFDADAAKLRADAEKAVDVKAAALVKELQRVQDAAMKRGDLDGANAIKATIEKLAPKEEKPKDPAAIKAELKQRMTGTFDFAFPTGHTGQLVIAKTHATDKTPGIEGDIRFVDDTAVIDWANGSHWTISLRDGDLSVQASDGRSVLKPATK